jgi:cobalt-zinc-cadmium efflux system outer membrane protein
MSRAVSAAIGACLLGALPARAQIVLTFEETVWRAREQAGAVAVARARITEAEAAVVDASARFRDNPVVEAGAGPRSGGGSRATDIEVGFAHQFETGGQRLARLSGAHATVDRQRAEVDRTSRGVVFEAASVFLEGIAANERLRLVEESDGVSRALLGATERRFAAGDVAAIDLNLARMDVARSAAALAALRADLAAALGRLRAILRLPSEPIELRGSLVLPPPLPLEQVLSQVAQRPEFAALAAEVREAEAQVQLGHALTRPDVGLRVGYEKEGRDSIVLGGLSVTLPTFQRGQGVLAAGMARASRARLEIETTRQLADAELQAAYSVYEARSRLAEALARDALPSAADNETLAQRSYEAGEMNLMDLLLIRRDALDIRATVIDRRLEAARSRLSMDFLGGVLR